jgi:hypothetical protein
MKYIYQRAGFECRCSKCGKVIREVDPRWVPEGFVKGRLCCDCYQSERGEK